MGSNYLLRIQAEAVRDTVSNWQHEKARVLHDAERAVTIARFLKLFVPFEPMLRQRQENQARIQSANEAYEG